MSGIKGFPSNQKLPLGSGITNEFTTVQPVDKYRNALDVAARFAFRVGGNVPIASEAGTGNIDGVTWVYHTATTAQVGDFVRFESGAAQYIEVAISKVETNRFMLGAKVDPAPASGDTFFIMRYATQRVEADGSQLVTVTPSPIAIVLDGVDTEISEDTVIPANTIPLPTKVVDGAGVLVDFATETTLAAADTKLGTANGHLAQIEADVTSLEAKDFATETTLAAVDTKVGSVIQTAAGDTFLMVGGRDGGSNRRTIHVDTQGDVQVDVLSSALPTGAATEATLATLATEVTLASVDAELDAQTTLLTSLDGKDFATETTLQTINTNLNILSNLVAPVPSYTLTNNYVITPVTTSAYVELIAAAPATCKFIEIFDSSGEALVLATGSVGFETDLIYIFPGGNGRIPVTIGLNERVSIKAFTNNATDGVLLINVYA